MLAFFGFLSLLTLLLGESISKMLMLSSTTIFLTPSSPTYIGSEEQEEPKGKVLLSPFLQTKTSQW